MYYTGQVQTEPSWSLLLQEFFVQIVLGHPVLYSAAGFMKQMAEASSSSSSSSSLLLPQFGGHGTLPPPPLVL